MKPSHINPAVIERALAGMSFLEISEDLGITRCTVAGIIFRARRKGMIFPTTRSEAPQNRPKPTQRPADAAPPRLRVVPMRAPKPIAEVDMNYQPKRVTIMELRDGICRWPLWGKDAKPSEHFYCGNESDGSHVYCAHCRSLSVATKPAAPVEKKVFSMKRRMAA